MASDMAKMVRVTWLVERGMMTANSPGSVVSGVLLALGILAGPGLSPAPPQSCAPGFVPNPYAAQCLAPVNTATINGVPCVPSNLGLCNSFVQNQQPRRMPVTSLG